MIHIQVSDPSKRIQRAYARAKENGILRFGNLNLTKFPDEIHRFNEYTLPGDNWWEDVPLTSIDLSNNPIPEIDPRISKLEELAVIKIMNAKIEIIPPGLFSAENLKVLDLAGNMITRIPAEIEKSLSLAQLNLSRNKIEVIPPGLGLLQNLDDLFLAENFINVIPHEVIKFLKK